MSDAVREAMGIVGTIIDRSQRLSGPINCTCGQQFLWWATFCDHLPDCPDEKRPEPEPVGEITVQSALDGMVEIGRILREPWGHDFATAQLSIDAFTPCMKCGQVQMAHVPPDARYTL